MSIQSIASPRLGPQPSLDGIRGFAIFAVLAFHFKWPGLPGGFFGVDVFFALSGFLITTLLLEEGFRFGQISLRVFFVRRCLRLYPALVCLVAVSTVYTLFIRHEAGVGRAIGVAVAVLGYAENWFSLLDASAYVGGMQHTWSLAVEAHFYVLWAIVLVSVARRYGTHVQARARLLRMLAILAVSASAGSALWRITLWANDAEWLRLYWATDTRLDGVFIGSAAALVRLQMLHSQRVPWLLRQGRLVTSAIEVLCAGIILTLVVSTQFGDEVARQDVTLTMVLAFTAISLATAVLILTTTHAESLLSTLLRFAPLVWLGQVSYSVYLWHVPAEKLVSSARMIAMGIPSVPAELIRLGITVAVGALSYYLVERTFLRLKGRVTVVPAPIAALGGPSRTASTSMVSMP